MELLLAHCSAAFSQVGSVFAVFFFGGLMGSLTHCLVMCGPVVACQSACGGGCGKRMSAASQWQYHLGRFTAYGALGFFVALLSKLVVAASYWPIVSSVMMVLAGVLFLVSAVFPSSHALLGYAPKNGFLRGALMSFMPCGLIYAALMMAATLANPLAGMFAMWLFVLGTIPALLIASGGAAILAIKWQEMMRGIGRFGMAFNGLTLLVMAARSMR
ncbi:MAG: sulfite exporter TauE/SafE family protein [Alphaproteobacteria bacterium]|nr:sulfite exporter TauE/SafE family protein [Alphaproteobacteria bacterium]